MRCSRFCGLFCALANALQTSSKSGVSNPEAWKQRGKGRLGDGSELRAASGLKPLRRRTSKPLRLPRARNFQ